MLTTSNVSRGERGHRFPQILPGGRFIYWVWTNKLEDTGVYASSFSKPSEQTHLLTAETAAVFAPGGDGKDYLLWLRGGTLMAQEFSATTLRLSGDPHPVADPVSSIGTIGAMVASASAGGELLYSASGTVSQFTWLDRTGRLLGVVGEPGGFTYPFRLSVDGRRAAVSRDRPGGNDLWLLDLERGFPSRFTFTSSTNIYPTWSPDGRTIMFSPISANLFRKDTGGSTEEQQVTQSPRQQYSTDWSRDGRLVLYQETAPDGQRDLWVLPVTREGKPEPGSKPRAYLQSRFNEFWGRFSPEPSPRWVAYQSDETGRNEVFIQSFPEPHGKFQISTGGGQYPQWASNGRELFYVALDNKLVAVSLEISVDSVRPSPPRPLFTMPISENGWSPYDTTPDGQKFLVRAVPPQASQALTVIVNWPALLKR